MGTFNVELQIGAADFSAWETVSALVDTGATTQWPRPVAPSWD